jgi:hypothetical protein
MDIQIYSFSGATKMLIENVNNAHEIASFQNTNYITATVQSTEYWDLIPGDFMTVNGENYHIIKTPECIKKGPNYFIWFLAFYHDVHFFDRSIMRTTDGKFNFDLTLDAEGFVDFILGNVNNTLRVTPEYFTKGSVDTTEPQNLRFEGISGLKALQMVCEAFGLQYKMASKVLSLTESAGAATGYAFRVSPDGGLVSIKRNPDSNDKVTTSLFFEGSKNNLPPGYRANATHPLGYDRLRHDNGAYIDNTRYYEIGGWEQYRVFDEIQPTFKGEVTTIISKKAFTATAIDFNINDHLVPGKTAKIVFTSGDLNGRSFEIANYNHTNKTITITIGYDESGNELPNDTVKPSVSDKFVFVDIYMPESYITSAESELQSKGTDLITKYNYYPSGYAVEFSEQFFKKNNITFKPGDKITVIDSDFSLNGIMQVMKYTRSLEDPFRYSNVEIAVLRRMSLQEKLLRAELVTRARTPVAVTKSITAGGLNEAQFITVTLTKKTKTFFNFTNVLPDTNYSIYPSSIMIANQIIWFEYPEEDKEPDQASVIASQDVTVTVTIIKHN